MLDVTFPVTGSWLFIRQQNQQIQRKRSRVAEQTTSETENLENVGGYVGSWWLGVQHIRFPEICYTDYIIVVSPN